MRFLAPKPHLTTSDTRYLVQVDGQDHVAVVAVLAENAPARRLVRGLPGRIAAERHAGPVDELDVDLAS